MRLTEHVELVGSGDNGFSLTNEYDCSVYLVDGGGECALIDAGVGVDAQLILEQICLSGRQPEQVKKILLTHGHGDHAGGAWKLAQITGAKVYAMEPAATFVSQGDVKALSLTGAIEAGVYEKGYQFNACPVLPLEDGEVVPVGDVHLRVIASEGHSAGHCCYLLEEENALFAGDSILCGGKIGLQAIWDCDLQKYIATIRRLAQLKPDALFPGHAGVALRRGYLHIDKANAALEELLLPKNSIGE